MLEYVLPAMIEQMAVRIDNQLAIGLLSSLYHICLDTRPELQGMKRHM